MKEKNLTAIQLGLVLLFALLIFTRRVREQFQTATGPTPIGMRVSGSQAGILAAQANGLVAKVVDAATGVVLFDEGVNELVDTDTAVKVFDLTILTSDPIVADLTKVNTPIEQSAAESPLVLKNYILSDPATNAISYNPPLDVATATTTTTATTTAAPTTAAPTTTPTTAAPTTAAPTTTAPTTTAPTTTAPTTTAPTTTAPTTAVPTTAAPTTAAPTASTAGTTPMGTTQAKKEDEGLSTGAIVAISLGSIVMVTAGLFVIFRSKTV